MLKRLFYLLLLVSCVISLSKTYAQEQESKTGGLARLMSMGQNPFVADPNDIKSNPAYAGYYGNLLWGDIGSQNTAWGSDGKSQFFGVNMNVTNVFTLGVMLTKSDQINGVSISSVDPYMFPLDVHFMQIIPNNNVEVLGSFNTDLMTLGFGVSYLTSQNKEDFALQASKNFEKNFTQIGFNAGVLFNLANQNKLDVSLAVIFPKLSMDTSIVTDKATQTYIKLSAKAFLNLNKEFQLVPIATFISGSGSEDYKDTISSSTNDLPTHT